MKKIRKNAKKILSIMCLLTPTFFVSTNYKIINKNSFFKSTNEEIETQEQMGDIVVNVKTDTTAKTKIITKYVSGTGVLLVSSDITEISDFAFVYQKNITKVDFSHATKLEKIGNNVFSNCSNLQGTFVFPESVKSIGYSIFVGTNIQNIFFLGSKPEFPSFYWIDTEWKGKVYVPSGMKEQYISDTLFKVDPVQVSEWTFDESNVHIQGDFTPINLLSNETNESQKLFSLSGVSEEIFSDMVSWELVPTKETQKIPNGLFVYQGIIRYSNLESGNYEFLIKIKWFDKEITSDQILQINSYNAQIDGNQNFSIIAGDPGQSKYSITSDPNGLTVNKWEIQMTQGEKPNWLSIDNNGLLSWTNESQGGEYSFKIICTPNTLSQQTIELPISITTYSNLKIIGEKNISGIIGKLNYSTFSVSSDPSPIKVDTWEIQMLEGNKPDWLSIDNSGRLVWTEKCVKGTYKFKLSAKNNEHQVWIDSEDITLNIFDSLEIRGKQQIYSYVRTFSSEQYSSTLGKDLDQWEIKMTEGNKPDWLSIDNTGLLSWTNKSEEGIYKFKLIGNSSKLSTTIESKEITLIISTDRIIGPSTITSKKDSFTSTKFTFIPAEDLQSVDKWEILMSEGEKQPEWLSITNDGSLEIKNTAPAGVKEIQIKATNTQTQVSTELKNVTIINYDNAEISGNKNIDALIGTSGSEKYDYFIQPESIKLDNVEIEMIEGAKPDWLTVDDTGLVSWTDQCVKGTYKFKLKFLDSSSPNINFISDEIQLNVYENSGLITGNTNIQTHETTSGNSKFEFFSEPVGLIADQWEIEMAEGEKPDWLTVDNNGLLSWSKKCKKGIYKFKLIAKNSNLGITVETDTITLEVLPKENNTNLALILGLIFGLGIPIILAAGFGIWHLTKKKKTTVKI